MGYLCWDSPQASVEDFTTYVEDHGMSGRVRGGGGLVRGAAEGMANGTALSLYIARFRLE